MKKLIVFDLDGPLAESKAWQDVANVSQVGIVQAFNK